MAHALENVRDCEILRTHPGLAFRSENYSYSIRREGNASIYTVTDGKAAITVPIAWAFGLGAAGQTYVFERDGSFYESRVSFYKAINGLDLTMGATSKPPANLAEAAGRKMDAADVRDCFGCHSTGIVNGSSPVGAKGSQPQLDTLVPGVHCEACHGSAKQHADSMRNGRGHPVAMQRLSALSTEDLSNLCGSCHRTWAQIAANGPRGILNVRFQPYRLANSKCYDVEDKRIACTACHDPHSHSVQEAALYDGKCAACHSAARTGVKRCPVGTRDCVTCHMPKVELPGAHFAFTDHQIRIAGKSEAYPN